MTANGDVFSSAGYREFLRAWLEVKGNVRGLQGRMCREIECQSAHLSRVLSEKIHLTMDQAHLATSFMGLSKSEADYFMKLVEYDRAGNKLYRQKLIDQLRQMKVLNENLTNRFQESRIGDLEKEIIYYSSWHYTAIHYVTAIESFRTAEEIALRLGLTVPMATEALNTLASFGLLRRNGFRWELNTGSLHLPKSSSLNSVQHGNWRNRAVLKSQVPSDDGIHYTVVQTVSQTDFDKIKQILLKALDDYKVTAESSPSEELTCLTLDYFRV